MATNPFDDPRDMSPADLATAAAFGQRFATFLAAGKTRTPLTSTSPRTNASNQHSYCSGVILISPFRRDDAMDSVPCPERCPIAPLANDHW